MHYQVCHSHSSGYGSRTHYLLVMSQLFKPFHSSASRSSRIRTDNLVNPNHAVYQIDIYSEMKWFCPSSSLCQHFIEGISRDLAPVYYPPYGYSSSFCGTLLQGLSTTYVSHLPFLILYKYYNKIFIKNQLNNFAIFLLVATPTY